MTRRVSVRRHVRKYTRRRQFHPRLIQGASKEFTEHNIVMTKTEQGWEGRVDIPIVEIVSENPNVRVVCVGTYNPVTSLYAPTVHEPIRELDFTERDVDMLLKLAKDGADHIASGGTLVITCDHGRHRSMILSSMILSLLNGKLTVAKGTPSTRLSSAAFRRLYSELRR